MSELNMSSYKVIDLDAWPRREHYAFYRKFASPAFSVTVSVNGDPIYRYAKARGESFFLLCLYAILRAANTVPQVRQRCVNGQVVEFDRIAAMTPIMTDSEMFRQVWCDYRETFAEFKASVTPDIDCAKHGNPAPMENDRADFICASCVPWLHFDSVTQADYAFEQDTPILAWGKMVEGKIPISVKFSHCFMDGLHVGRFFDDITEGFAHPEIL